MNKYDVAAYIWPAYTGDEPRARQFWPDGMGEWQSVKNAVSKFEGHSWPRKPLWGYVNEADPYVMEMEINAAADHGVNVFIYDWYWYDRRPFLEQCLNNGYLKAKNNHRVKFYLMWANHSANGTWDKRLAGTPAGEATVWQGGVDEAEFDRITDRLIQKYFGLPNYYRIDGKPVFQIYELAGLIEGLGGVENTRRCLEKFKQKCVAAGLGGLHLMLTKIGDRSFNLSGVDSAPSPEGVAAPQLGFDSLTNYQYVHFTTIDRPYAETMQEVVQYWKKWTEEYTIPFFPHISVGWDNNPRFNGLRTDIALQETPAEIEKALRLARQYVDTHPLPAPLVTVNSWNEWTETSYLEPDDRYGYGYLQAIRRVFCEE